MKKVPVVRITTPDAAVGLAGLPLAATVAMADVAAAMREGLLAFSTAAGLVVMRQMLTEELASIVGAKHARLGADRVGNWHGTTTGQVVLGSQKITVSRPRGRFVDGGEVELATWETFASEDLLRQVVVERMLAGVATRRHVDVAEPVGVDGQAQSKSAVSRRFKAATEAALTELLARDLSGLETAVLMIDGLNVAGQMITVAVIITADGTKVPVGRGLGDTENTVVVTDLLADLVARGLRYDHGILAVIDGSKALRKGVVKVFGERALVQRCTLHKRRINRPWRVGQEVVVGRTVRRCRWRWSATRAWRADSLVQPRCSASSWRWRMSSSCSAMRSARAGSGTKLSHCSQMFE
jgi:putative transposase